MDAVRRIIKITSIVCIVYDVYRFARKEMRKRRAVRPLKKSRDEAEFYAARTRQLKAPDEEHLFEATRMEVANFNLLMELLRQRLQRYSRRKPVCPETRLSLTLLYLAQGCNVDVMAWSHDMGISTLRKIIYETCDAIWEELSGIYMAPPNSEDYELNANMFYVKTGMPNCLGAIDGKHINIVRPKRSGPLYYNYKKGYSIALLGACDANYRFTFVDVGTLGSQSDGGIFVRSHFGKKILNESLEVPPDRLLPDESRKFPYYFVANNSFPLKCNLMRPFPGRNLSADKENFNINLSKTLVYIENAFGILANRWKVLQTHIHAMPENVVKIVLATILLHNFLIVKKDSRYFNMDLVDRIENGVHIDGNWRRETNALKSIRHATPNRSMAAAFELRNVLKDFLHNYNSNM